MFSWIIYGMFRLLAQVYLYFTNTAGHWKVLENSWENNDISFKRYRIQNEGHERHFVFVEPGIYLDGDIDWHRVICFSDSILACTLRPVRVKNEDFEPLDITDTIKEFSHYIYSNTFLTLDDLLTLFNINLTEQTGLPNSNDHYNLMIIFSDLSEKECIVKGEDSLQMIFNKNTEHSLEDIPFM